MIEVTEVLPIRADGKRIWRTNHNGGIFDVEATSEAQAITKLTDVITIEDSPIPATTVAQITGLQAFLDDKASLNDNIKLYVDGVKKDKPKIFIATGTISSGSVTFNVTDDGTASGNAIFNNIYLPSIDPKAFGTSKLFAYGTPTASADKKTITVSVKQITAVVIGLLDFVNATNGITVYTLVIGD